MRCNWRQYLFIGLAGLGLLLTANPTLAGKGNNGGMHRGKGPPAHAPAHGYRAKHSYRYYPNAKVYFDVDKKLYFYLHQGNWLSAPKLPALPGFDPQDFVPLELATDSPFKLFEQHVQQFSAGKSKKSAGKKP